MVAAPKIAMAFVRAAPPYEPAIRAIAGANANAPPSPWTARETFSATVDGASPHASDARVNTASPPVNTRRLPAESASEPAVSSTEAKTSV
nr:hypothetical protein GCM10020093_022660 [Planobispora longispora]